MTRTLLLALLLRRDGTRQIRQDLAGAHDQLGDLILGLCWVLRIDRGDVAERRVVGRTSVRFNRRNEHRLVHKGLVKRQILSVRRRANRAANGSRRGKGTGGASHDLVKGGGE